MAILNTINMQFITILQKLGLALNEAKIYETLLINGQLGISAIASYANINRRNVYDSIDRLREKGVVIAVVQGRDTVYAAVDPKKLLDLIHEQEFQLQQVLPEMNRLFSVQPTKHDVMMYEGHEGWKTYMQEFLRSGEDLYSIGARGKWLSSNLEDFGVKVIREAKKKKIKLNILFDSSVLTNVPEAIALQAKHARILPESFSASATIDVFGDRVVIGSDDSNNTSSLSPVLTVIHNRDIADSFRVWWQALWNISKPIPKRVLKT